MPAKKKTTTKKTTTKRAPKIRKEATPKEELGFLGEWLCQEHFNIELSYNPLEEHHPQRNNKFDSEKDGVDPNGRNVEIKTQNRHPMGYFTVDTANKNQVKKCTEVTRLLFVEYDNSNDIKIWECHDRAYRILETKDGRKMASWPIKQMQLLLTVGNVEYAERMRSLSSSKIIKK